MTRSELKEVVETLEVLDSKIKDTESELNLLKTIRRNLENDLGDWTEEELMRPVL